MSEAAGASPGGHSAAEGLRELIARALAEDVGPGDATSEAVVPPEARARARIVQKAPGVLFGLDAAAEAFRQAGAESFDPAAVEGRWRDEVPVQVALVTGSARALLAGERTALNLLGHLSGVATLAARFAAAVEGTGTQVLDTRKTTPGLRTLEKAAVRAGGGHNHRMGLYDAILIKENHAALAGGVGEAVRRAREARPDLELEVECRDLGEVREALRAGATRLLLDNMETEDLRASVAARDQAAVVDGGSAAAAPGTNGGAVLKEAAAAGTSARRITLEASGGITLANVREIAETGVDFVSVGALTHSAPALDVSMLLDAA